MDKKDPPIWSEGAIELLQHALEHLAKGSEFDRRIAMVGIDNSVELLMRTYLGLPARLNGIKTLSRNEYDEMSPNFSKLVDGFEKYASEMLTGIEMGEIEFFHRIRNEVYHEGNGLSVETRKVTAYASIAKVLFKNVTRQEVDEPSSQIGTGLIGEFMESWFRLERFLSEGGKQGLEGRQPGNKWAPWEFDSLIPSDLRPQLQSLRHFRNRLVHGAIAPTHEELRGKIKATNGLLALIASNGSPLRSD